MSKFSDRFKQLRKQRNLSQQDLANQLGYTKSRINMYERGEREPSYEVLEEIADYFNVDLDYLHGKSDIPNRNEWLKGINASASTPDNITQMPVMHTTPLVGTIACGTPILAEENREGDVDLPEHIHADFALRCKGDSMINARIYDGDIVYIRQQDTVEHGEIAAVLIGTEATLKRVFLFDDHITLEAENPQYRPMSYWGDEMNDVRILGKAVAFTSTVR